MGIPYESYPERLIRNRREAEERRRNTPKPKTLSEQICEWYESLSPAEQRASYTMEWFQMRFAATPQQLGLTLFSLGWRRRRLWRTDRPNCRVWVRMGADKNGHLANSTG